MILENEMRKHMEVLKEGLQRETTESMMRPGASANDVLRYKGMYEAAAGLMDTLCEFAKVVDRIDETLLRVSAQQRETNDLVRYGRVKPVTITPPEEQEQTE